MKLNWFEYIDFNEGNVKKYIPQKAGVYKISAVLINSDKLRVDYIGQAKDLEERSYQHLSNNEENFSLKEALNKYHYKISFAEVGYQDDRNTIERALYENYKPKFNDPKCIPNVEPVNINFN